LAEWESISLTTIVHRIGGGSVENLRLKPKEQMQTPPGISVLLGGTAREAAEQVRRAFPYATRLRAAAKTVGSATVDEIRRAGFDVMPDPTRHFENHGRLIHPDGVAGFRDDNLVTLAQVFRTTSGLNDAS
jgi:hypothetical protein